MKKNLNDVWNTEVQPLIVVHSKYKGVRLQKITKYVPYSSVSSLHSYAEFAVKEVKKLRKVLIENGLAKFNSDGEFEIL